MRDKVAFEPNIPVELSLAFPQGKIVDGRFGQQVMYALDFPAGSIMFLDLAVSQKITGLDIQPGERFFVCKRPKNGQTPARWDLWLSPATEQMRAHKLVDSFVPPEPPSMLERQLAASIHEAQQTRKGPQSQPAMAAQARGNGTTGPVPMPKPVTQASPIAGLVAETNALVDAFAEVMERTLRQYEGRIKPEEVRSLLLSAYIQRGKHGA